MTEAIEQFAARVMRQFSYTPDSLDEVLTRELPAFLAQHRQVVEVTAEDVHECNVESFGGRNYSHADTANRINARLRARAVPASRPALDVEKVAREIANECLNHTLMPESSLPFIERHALTVLRRHATDTGWVQVPTTQTAGELVVPEDGRYAIKFAGPSPQKIDVAGYKAGMKIGENIDAIRRIDTNEPTTWIERTPTTTRAWTAESVQECVGRDAVVIDGDDVIDTYGNQYGADAAVWAAAFNRQGVTAFYLLPEPPR
jgi:hypothetical protein